jgi:hypothetical protein
MNQADIVNFQAAIETTFENAPTHAEISEILVTDLASIGGGSQMGVW